MMRWLSLLVILLAGCGHTPNEQGITPWDRQEVKGPDIQYLGVGGWLLEWQGEQLLFAPSFSNPAFYRLPFNTTADIDSIDRLMPDASRATMILVGHGHYDHLLDVSRIAQKQAPSAIIYGSRNVTRILAATLPGNRRVAVEDKMSQRWTENGDWIPSARGNFRAMPIRSQHAPHFLGLHLVPDSSYEKELDHLPISAWTWRGGQSVSWLVDLLDENQQPVYRIHYQDSAATPPYGFPPVFSDNKPVDLQILCAGSWNQVRDYPVKLLQVTKPRIVAIGHWENFIGGDLKAPTLIPLLDLKKLKDIVQDTVRETPVIVPAPFSRIPLDASAL